MIQKGTCSSLISPKALTCDNVDLPSQQVRGQLQGPCSLTQCWCSACWQAVFVCMKAMAGRRDPQIVSFFFSEPESESESLQIAQVAYPTSRPSSIRKEQECVEALLTAEHWSFSHTPCFWICLAKAQLHSWWVAYDSSFRLPPKVLAILHLRSQIVVVPGTGIPPWNKGMKLWSSNALANAGVMTRIRNPLSSALAPVVLSLVLKASFAFWAWSGSPATCDITLVSFNYTYSIRHSLTDTQPSGLSEVAEVASPGETANSLALSGSGTTSSRRSSSSSIGPLSECKCNKTSP